MGATNILGIDPGLANLGVAVVAVDLRADLVAQVLHVDTLQTDYLARKRDLRVATDNTRRARELSVALQKLDKQYPIGAVCAEELSHPRSASAAIKVAIAWGAIVNFAAARSIPIVELPPQVIKRSVAGAKSASKQRVKAALDELYLAVPWPYGERGGSDKIPHAADALAAATAGMESDLILALLQARGGR